MSLGSWECWRTPPSHQSHHHLTDPAPERQHQIRPSTLKPASLECNVDTQCPLLILPDHKTTTFLINPLYFTWSLYGTSTLYDNYWTWQVRAGQGSVLIGRIGDSDGKISISVFSVSFPAKGKKLRISSKIFKKLSALLITRW